MKKKLPPAKTPLPRFRSDSEAADEPARLSKALERSIRKRHTAARSPISIRLGTEQIAAAKKIAAAKSVGYQTQLRMWIAEGIKREAKRA